MTNLTDRIAALLTDAPQTSSDIWDRLADESVRRSDVVGELYAMRLEGRAAQVSVDGEMAYSVAVAA